ncbi:free fatty acid receptor 3-like [Oxyura jamaicensis]|uniref:free fatty acid receptor 3-like n=1 Tax=Oxyura jamaicensis TaxID=8884 RepID=UPI0015A6B6CF|nr:free fatty acid receptor 3-like [Oxyura jamaicensis]
MGKTPREPERIVAPISCPISRPTGSCLPCPPPPFAINHRLCLVVYAGAFTLGLPLNLVALVALGVAARRRRLLPADVLLLNLIVADLALVASLPVRMAEAAWEATWKLPPALCPLFVFLFFTSVYLTTLSLTALSVDRYLSAAFPVQYRQRRRAAHAAVAAAGSWAAALGHCSVVYVAQPGPAGNGTACYTRFAGPQLATLLALRLEIFLVLFCLPLAITAFCYGRLVCIVAALPTAAQGRKRRVVALAAATMAAFILCFAPFNVSHVVGYLRWENPPWRAYAVLLTTLNACLDPLIFCFSSDALRRGLWQVWDAMGFSWLRARCRAPSERSRGLAGGAGGEALGLLACLGVGGTELEASQGASGLREPQGRALEAWGNRGGPQTSGDGIGGDKRQSQAGASGVAAGSWAGPCDLG